MRDLAEPHVLSILPYIPGRPIDNKSKIKSWAKLASNENCLGASPKALEYAQKNLKNSYFYPNFQRDDVVDSLVSFYRVFNIKNKHIALGNGASELITNLVRGLVSQKEHILYFWPGFVMYHLVARIHGVGEVRVNLNNNFSYDPEKLINNLKNNKVKLIFLANPNNPTGTYLNKKELEYIIKKLPKEIILVIDEAYFEYVCEKDYPNGLIYALERPRTVVLRTFSKVFGLAGLRLGYAIGDPAIIDIISRVRDPFNINSVAQSAALGALQDPEHVKKSIEHNKIFLPLLAQGLEKFGFKITPSVANFVLACVNHDLISTKELVNKLLGAGVIIRPLKNYNLDNYVRISVGTQDNLEHLFSALGEILNA